MVDGKGQKGADRDVFHWRKKREIARKKSSRSGARTSSTYIQKYEKKKGFSLCPQGRRKGKKERVPERET